MNQFLKETVKIIVFDKEYILTKATLKQVREYQKELKELKDKGDEDSLGSVLNLLNNHGLPLDVSEELTVKQIIQVTEIILDTKKN